MMTVAMRPKTNCASVARARAFYRNRADHGGCGLKTDSGSHECGHKCSHHQTGKTYGSKLTIIRG
jgi:hypothetical protein